MDKALRELINDLRSRDKPEVEIPYVHYPTEIDFNKCSNTKDYKVCRSMVNTIKKYHNRVFTNYDEKLEDKKNKMRELIFKFFDMNKVTDNDDRNQLLEYLKDERTYELFLIVLLKLRKNNRFCREKLLIGLLSEILIIILNYAQKDNNWDFAKKLSFYLKHFITLMNQRKRFILRAKLKIILGCLQ